ncbi:MAG TPA: hypothetical protein VFS24_20255 [Steroidobacteraceae bacterium]|nr:hypothetical protein [Steroidobacteraceae bacterium]
MKKRLLLASVLMGMALTAQAECPFPKPPATIPDGKTASEPDMIAAMKEFKAYNEEVQGFAKCLDEESNDPALSPPQKMQLKTLQKKKQDAAMKELQEKAAAFNEQVRVFKSRSG